MLALCLILWTTGDQPEGSPEFLLIIVQGEQNRNKNNNNNCRIIQFKGLKEEEEKGLTLNIFMRLILNNLTDYNNLN